MKRVVTMVVLCAFLVLGAAATASASSRDRNRDRIPDKWEKRHGLSLKVKQTRRDQDRDGLNNLGEFRAGDDPRDRDTDGDGLRDGKERAGKIASFDGTKLVISLFGGGTAEGTVNDATEIECEAGDQPSATTAGSGRDGSGSGSDDASGDDNSGRGSSGDDRSGEAEPGDDRGNEPGTPGDDRGQDENEDDCTTADLKVGAVVDEAKLRLTSDGLVFREIELES